MTPQSKSLLGLVALLALDPAGAAQTSATAQKPRPGVVLFDPVPVIQGKVKDLARDAAGRILYCTAEGQVGRIQPQGVRSVLATAASGPFPSELRALAETPSGDIAVLDAGGDVHVLYGASAPATLVYDDVYMIQDATDLIVDARGSYLIASATPSNGLRAMNWIQDDGAKWSYYLVKHQPVQLAHDPLTGGIVMAETSSGGNLQLVQAGSSIRATTTLDASTHPGLTLAEDDGDLAAEADGDLYWIAGGEVYKHVRATGTTVLFASGYAQLRGVVIAASSGWVSSTSGWSLYLAEGENPTRLREIPGVGAPGAVIANDQGAVPGRGIKVNVSFGFQVYELAADNAGRLLVGGTYYGSTHHIKRVTLTGTPSIAPLASSADGLAGIVEGLCVAPDDSIYALARTGTIQRITEGPLALSTVFGDPAGQITAGKDLALDVNGALYVACRESWDFGKVMRVAGGGATLLTLTEEALGLAANPSGGMFVSQWHDTGFNGTVDLFHFDDNSLETLPGFAGMNYTNGSVWGDGDVCVDANGWIYTVSEDDWSLVRYHPNLDGFVRFGSGYLNRPSGLAIAPSTAGSGSTTGWSLYVSEYDNLWEKPSVAAPASTLVDSSLGLTAGRSLAGATNPSYGRPRVLAPIPGPAGGAAGVLIGTASGWVLALDPVTGEARPVAGPEQGLRGEIVALAAAPSGRRILALGRDGDLFELSAGRVRRLPLEREVAAAALEHALAAPQRVARVHDQETRASAWLVLDGWVVWRVGSEP